MSHIPSEAPPAYERVAHPNQSSGAPPNQAQSSANAAPTSVSSQSQNTRTAPERSASQIERDIQKEDRPLPPGWVAQYDEQYDRFFFVDTNHRGGPRAIWTHPLDDPEWLATVPNGKTAMEHVGDLWNAEPMPTPEPGRRPLPQTQYHGQPQQPSAYSASGTAAQSQTRGLDLSQLGRPGPDGKRVVTMQDLVEYYMSKETPEEHERKNPRSDASSLFHRKESASKRQRRHAEHKARDLADALSYRRPVVSPYYSNYGYPGYGRGYGGRYPGLGMSGAMIGLGTGALLFGGLGGGVF